MSSLSARRHTPARGHSYAGSRNVFALTCAKQSYRAYGHPPRTETPPPSASAKSPTRQSRYGDGTATADKSAFILPPSLPLCPLCLCGEFFSLFVGSWMFDVGGSCLFPPSSFRLHPSSFPWPPSPARKPHLNLPGRIMIITVQTGRRHGPRLCR